MYFVLKRHGYDLVGTHIDSKWSINLNLSFFGDIRKGYIAIGGKRIIPILNQISFYGLIFGPVILILTAH